MPADVIDATAHVTSEAVRSRLKQRAGRIGFHANMLSDLDGPQLRGVVDDLESFGYGSVWAPEHEESMSRSALMLSGGSRILVGTAMAPIGIRDAAATTNGARNLATGWDDRFVLGITCSHVDFPVNGRVFSYESPVAAMRVYLDQMDAAEAGWHCFPSEPVPRVLGVQGPKLQELAAERATGVLSYLGTPEHTRRTREIIGDGPFLGANQPFVLADSFEQAKEFCGPIFEHYMKRAHYRQHVESLGFGAGDIGPPASDRLIDGLLAWGDPQAIADRVQQHFDAGADHVALCIHPMTHPLDADHSLPVAAKSLAEALALRP